MIFVHDHTFIKNNKEYYTSGSLNNNLFLRYIEWFGEVEVLANERIAVEKDNKLICEQNLVNNVKLRLFNKSHNILNILKRAKKIEESISKQDFLVARVPSIYGIMAVRYARKHNIPFLLEVVGCPWDALWNHGLKGKALAPIMWMATKLVVINTPYTLYVTNVFLQKRYPCRGKTLGCSDVALPSLNQGILEKRIVKINKMDKNKPIILGTTASIDVRYKGQEYVIRAISLLNKEGYNFEYHLAGGGDNKYLKTIAKKYGVIDKVKFLGSLPHEKVFEYLDNIDVYIQPSKTEGLPRALIEAMSRGCPCIGADVGGIPELLRGELIYNSKSVNKLCTILKRLDVNIMLDEADRNFTKSKEYRIQLLSQKRTDFYNEFIRSNYKKF